MRNHGRTTATNGDGFRRLEVITGIGRRRRWTDEDKARIVAESLDPATTVSGGQYASGEAFNYPHRGAEGARLAPRVMSVSRERPRHMTVLPGGGSPARAR